MALIYMAKKKKYMGYAVSHMRVTFSMLLPSLAACCVAFSWGVELQSWCCMCVGGCADCLQMAAEEQKHYIVLDEIVLAIGKAEPGVSLEFNRLNDALYDSPF